MNSFDISEESHDSYVVASFSRVSGGNFNFFGTHLKPNYFFEFRIYPAKKVITEFGEERFSQDYDKSVLLELRLTAHQFSELITTMNMGNGTPLTLTRKDGRKVQDCPEQSTSVDAAISVAVEKIEKSEYQERITKAAIEILNSEKPINKKERATLVEAFVELDRRLHGNAKFYKDQICEIGEKVKSEIRTEIDAQMSAVVNKLGLKSLEKLRLEEKNE